MSLSRWPREGRASAKRSRRASAKRWGGVRPGKPQCPFHPHPPIASQWVPPSPARRGERGLQGWRVRMHRTRILITAAALLLGIASGTTRAATIEEFYKGSRLTLYIGSDVGAGYDLYARVLARHLAKHIPGNPNIVPENMPGAG